MRRTEKEVDRTDKRAEPELKAPVLNYAKPQKRQRISFHDALWWIAILIAAMVILTIIFVLLFPANRNPW